MLQNRSMQRAGFVASSLVVLGLTLSGCAQQGGLAAASTASDDVCRTQRLALDDSQTFFAGDIVKGALIGAAGGALSGFLFGGDARGAAIGAAAGAAVGGLGGYWASLQNSGGSRNDLISRMVGDMDREQQALDKAQSAFNALVECRRASARQINADLRAGTINRGEAESRMAKVRALADQDIAIAKRINARLDERTGNYVYATEQATGQPLQTATAAPPPTMAQPSTGRAPAARPAPRTTQPAAATSGEDAQLRQSASTLVQKKQSFEQSTQTAQQSLASDMAIG